MDFVITWVDGNDAVWQESKQKAAMRAGELSMADAGNERYRSWDNLQYWFRGVEKYAPWVDRIHLITCGHLPEWLNTAHPKLNIVKHSDYMPQDYLPCFNSDAIELNMHRISGLSEQFVYFNDDMFVINRLEERDFFRGGKPCDMLAFQPVIANPQNPTMSHIYLNNVLVLSKYYNKRKNVSKQPGAYFHPGYPPLYFFYNLLELGFPQYTGFYNVHGASPFLKSTFEELWEKEGAVLDETSRHTFRGDDVSQYLLKDWQKLSGNFVPMNVQKLTKYFNVSRHNEKLVRTIRSQNSKMVCINDADVGNGFDIAKKEINEALESIFPEKCSFELGKK